MIGDPFSQNPYAKILQRVSGRIRDLENMGNVVPPQRPNINQQRLGAARQSPVQPGRTPYNFNFGSQSGSPIKTEVTY